MTNLPEQPGASPATEYIAPDLLAYLRYVLEQQRQAQLTAQNYAAFLTAHYGLQPADQITLDGQVVRGAVLSSSRPPVD